MTTAKRKRSEQRGNSGTTIGRPFPKGVSPNPGGRPQIPEELRKRGPGCITFLLDMAEGKVTTPDGRTLPAPLKHRIAAAMWCAERLFGKARQEVEIESKGLTPAAAAMLELVQLRRAEPRAEPRATTSPKEKA